MLSINACAQTENTNSLTNDEFKNLLNSDSTLIILDVRTPAELDGPLGKVENVINIPIQELNRRINELEEYKNREITVICRTQNRSSAAVDILLRHGYKAKCVLGGMMEYSRKQ